MDTPVPWWTFGGRLRKVRKFMYWPPLPTGKQRLFMVDTGASVSVLSTEVANELGLTAVEPAHGELIGLSGSARWYRAQLPALSLGEHEFYNVDFAVGVPGVPNRAGAVPLAGILGNNVWRRFGL